MRRYFRFIQVKRLVGVHWICRLSDFSNRYCTDRLYIIKEMKVTFGGSICPFFKIDRAQIDLTSQMSCRCLQGRLFALHLIISGFVFCHACTSWRCYGNRNALKSHITTQTTRLTERLSHARGRYTSIRFSKTHSSLNSFSALVCYPKKVMAELRRTVEIEPEQWNLWRSSPLLQQRASWLVHRLISRATYSPETNDVTSRPTKQPPAMTGWV